MFAGELSVRSEQILVGSAVFCVPPVLLVPVAVSGLSVLLVEGPFRLFNRVAARESLGRVQVDTTIQTQTVGH